jgi:hypothetical protein
MDNDCTGASTDAVATAATAAADGKPPGIDAGRSCCACDPTAVDNRSPPAADIVAGEGRATAAPALAAGTS